MENHQQNLPVAFYNSRCQNRNYMRGKLADIVSNPEEHTRTAKMVAAAHMQASQCVAVQDHQVVSHLPGNNNPKKNKDAKKNLFII